MSDEVNVVIAAQMLRYGLAYTRRLCQDGVLRATKPGRDWLIRRSEIERFKATQPGRKRGRRRRKEQIAA